MNYLQKKILTIAAGIANIALSLAVAATATFAWFATQNQVTAEAINISTSAPETTLTWKILSFDDNTKKGVKSTNSADYKLPDYDRFVTSKNEYSNVILRAVVDVSSYDYSKTSTNYNQIYVDVSCDPNSLLSYAIVNSDVTGGPEGTPDGKKDGVPNKTSNICQFKAAVAAYSKKTTPNVFDGVGISAIHDEVNIGASYNDDNEYTSATSFFKTSNLTTNAFVTFHSNTPNKRDNKITIIPKFDCGTDTVGKIVVYLECSYSPELVEYYHSTHPNQVGEIKLNGDITNIIFRAGKGYSGAYVKVDDQNDLKADDSTLADGTESHTSNDYLIVNDDERVSFDSANYSQSYDYRDAKTRASKIINDENTFKTRWNYNPDSKHLTTSSGQVYGNNDNQQNTLTYDTDHVNAVSNEQKIQYDNSENVTAFGYSNTDKENVQFYKYSDSAVENPTLDHITVGGVNNPEILYLNEEFSFRGTVTATYSDGSTSDVTDLCSFTGYNMSALDTPQSVRVVFTDEGITKSTSYNIKVVNRPYLTMDFNKLSGANGTYTTNTVYRHNFINDSLTYTWTSSDTTKVTITNINNDNGTARVNFVAVTTSPVTVTVRAVSALNEAAEATFTVKVFSRQTGTATYTPTSRNTVSSSGETPDGSSATYYNTYSSGYNQMTSGNSTTLTLSGYDGCTITSLSMSMRSNSDSGKGSFTMSTNGNSIASIADSKFNTSNWYGDWSTSPVPVTVAVDSSIVVGNAKTIVLTISCTTKSLYIYSYTIGWSKGQADTPELVKIGLSNITDQFYVGSDFVNPTITAYYDDQSTATIAPADCSITGYDMSSAGTQTVTVSYTENDTTVIAQYNIEVAIPGLSSITCTGQKTSFYVGDTFTVGPDFVVRASYADGSNAVVTDYADVTAPTSQQMSTQGTYTVNVSYTEGNVTKSTSYDITVNAVTLSKIEVTTQPTNKTYYVNDVFDPTGMVVTATYSNNSTDVIANNLLSYKTTALSTSDSTFTIQYNGKSTSISLTILKANVVLNVSTLSGIAGGTGSLSATPNNFRNTGSMEYTWTSSNTTVARVSGSGSSVTIEYRSNGSATITCSASDGSQTASATCSVTVSPLSVSLSPNSLSLVAGSTGTFTITTNGTIYNVSSGTTSVATVDSDHEGDPTGTSVTVTAKSSGSATITVQVKYGDDTYASTTCSVSVSALYVTLNPTSLSLTEGGSNGSFTISTNGTIRSVVSGTTSVATVDSNHADEGTGTVVTVTPVSEGSSTIKVTVKNGNQTKEASCEVTVEAESQQTESLVYTLDGTSTGGSNGYATESDITQSGVSWKVTANTTENPWRIGGKSISNTDRPVYSTDQVYSGNVTKIEVLIGDTGGSITLNSVTLIVASDSSFSNQISTETKNSPSANSTLTFSRPNGKEWTNRYYKFNFKVTVSGSKNKYYELSAIKFYAMV